MIPSMSHSPLRGARVLVTRPHEQAQSWLSAIAATGAVALPYPTIAVGPPPSWAPLDSALAHVTSYDWLILASPTAARFVTSRWPPVVDPKTLAKPGVAAVGSETAHVLAQIGLPVALVPQEQNQEGLMIALSNLPPGTRVLFPQAIGGREELCRFLTQRGCIVDVVPASQTVPIVPLPPVPAFDVATFASPTALQAFVAAHGATLLHTKVLVAIGPTTARLARTLGLSPILAGAPNIQSVIAAIELSYSHQGA